MSESIGRLLFCGLVLTAGTSSSLSDTITLLQFAGRGRRIDGLWRGAREHLVFRRLHGTQAPPFASTREIDFFSTQHSQGGLWILSIASARFFTLPDALGSPAPAPPFPVSLSFTPAGSLPVPFLFAWPLAFPFPLLSAPSTYSSPSESSCIGLPGWSSLLTSSSLPASSNCRN